MADFLVENSLEKPPGITRENGIRHTSSFRDRIDLTGSATPGDELESILAKNSKRWSDTNSRRMTSPRKAYSPPREYAMSVSPRPRRERSYLRSSSPDKPVRQSSIWSQWEQSKKADECTQDFNVRQMGSLYGKKLGGKVDAAQEWYMKNGLDRSKTQSEALGWLSEGAVQSATAPVAFTPRGTQTETPLSSRGPSEDDHQRYVGSPYKNREMRTREQLKAEQNMNKLSTRHRVQKTPSVERIRERESKFTNDAIVTERRRTRFKDIIPQYDASADRHCKAYFKRNDVQKLVAVTRSREPTPAGSLTPGPTPVRNTPRPTPGPTPF